MDTWSAGRNHVNKDGCLDDSGHNKEDPEKDSINKVRDHSPLGLPSLTARCVVRLLILRLMVMVVMAKFALRQRQWLLVGYLHAQQAIECKLQLTVMLLNSLKCTWKQPKSVPWQWTNELFRECIWWMCHILSSLNLMNSSHSAHIPPHLTFVLCIHFISVLLIDYLYWRLRVVLQL